MGYWNWHNNANITAILLRHVWPFISYFLLKILQRIVASDRHSVMYYRKRNNLGTVRLVRDSVHQQSLASCLEDQ